MRVIPAIDLIDGRPVRLSEGDYSRRREYSMTALDAAKRFEDGGLRYLHLVDLDAARGDGSNLAVLERIASCTSLEIDFGGGIRSREAESMIVRRPVEELAEIVPDFLTAWDHAISPHAMPMYRRHTTARMLTYFLEAIVNGAEPGIIE